MVADPSPPGTESIVKPLSLGSGAVSDPGWAGWPGWRWGFYLGWPGRAQGGVFKESLGVPCISKVFMQGSVCPGEETGMNMAMAAGPGVQGWALMPAGRWRRNWSQNDGRGQAICGNGGGCFSETLCRVYVSVSHMGMISDDEFHSSHKPSQRWDRKRLYISLLLNSVSFSKDRQHWRVWIPVLFNWDQRVPYKSPAVKCPKNDQRRHGATSHPFLIFWFVF